MTDSVLPDPRLFVAYDADLDWLMAYEFGRVDDGQPHECWIPVGEQCGLLLDRPGGRIVGFRIQGFSIFDADDEEVAALWCEPLFDAPQLGLIGVPAAAVAVAARSFFGEESSFSRQAFDAATGAHGAAALAGWRSCLQCGDMLAHFGLGYTLYEHGDLPAAYRHLRYYTEIAPGGPWTWCWFGRAAEAVGQRGEAIDAYRRAIALTEQGGEETDAPELLAALQAAAAPVRRLELLGAELTQLDRPRIEALSDRVAGGLTRGRHPKRYSYTDPNEDALVVAESGHGVLIVCADGHNGRAASHAAVAEVTERLGDAPMLDELGDEALIALWAAVGERVRVAAQAAGTPESRTTLIVALLSGTTLRWAAMGDSLLVVAGAGGVERLDTPRHRFVGWPMTAEEIGERLQRGTCELGPGDWVVVATDGYTDFVTPGLEPVLAASAAASKTAAQLVDVMIESACAGGAGDNVAVAVARAGEHRSERGEDG